VQITNNLFHVSTRNSPTDGAICVDGVRIVPVETPMTADAPAASTTAALLESSRPSQWGILRRSRGDIVHPSSATRNSYAKILV
jgi:hypothetical protein